MKTLSYLIFAMVMATSVFAKENAVDSFKSILQPGKYKGNNFTNECFVTVEEVNFPDVALKVTVRNDIGELSKLITPDSNFGTNPSKKFYIQSDRKTIGQNDNYFIETTLRTIFKDDALNVQLTELYVIEGNFNEGLAECRIQI